MTADEGHPAAMSQLKIDWALFCRHTDRVAERPDDSVGFLTITKVFRHVPITPPGAGIHTCLVFAVSGKPLTIAPVQIAIVWPRGSAVHDVTPIACDLGVNGYTEHTLVLGMIAPQQLGDIRAEFRFGREFQPAHVAILRVVPEASLGAPAPLAPGTH